MKNKKIYYNLFFTVAILFTMLFPSIHAMQHFNEVAVQNTCEHKQTNKHEITHQHTKLHDCFTCGFTLNFAGALDYQHYFFNVSNNYKSLISGQLSFFVTFFKGSLYLLRGPPAI